MVSIFGMASSTVSLEAIRPSERRRIFLNAFDMFTVGHLSFGQWRRPNDRSKDKRRDLTYWTDLAQLLEKGDINALFLADTYGQYDVYKKSSDPTLITGAQFPMGDPIIVSIGQIEKKKEAHRIPANICDGCGNEESWVCRYGLNDL